MPVPDFSTLQVELDDEHVVTVTLDRPERFNAFNQTMLEDFDRLWRWVKATDDAHVVVLQANGERAFCTGVDVVDGFDRDPNPFSERDPGEWLSPKANQCWKPFVVAVHGMVAGGAFYWINEADVVIAAEDATFFDPHVTYGMTAALEPIGLVRRVPIGEVMRMVLLGNDERMSAQRAHQIGLVSEIVSTDQLRPRAHDLGARIASKPTHAVQGSVKAVWQSLDVGRSQALASGMSYVQIGNPLSEGQVDRSSRPGRKYEIR